MKIKQVGLALEKNSILWKYLDFHKFLSFIINQSIFFNRMDKMEDINEGISMNQLIFKYGNEVEKEIIKKEKEIINRKELSLTTRQQKYFLSCWLIHHRESVAMWNSYSDANGIAIRTNGDKLIQSIKENSELSDNCEKMKSMYYGKVVYKDFFHEQDRKEFKEEIEIIGFQKDICFSYENEFRFLFKQDLHRYKAHNIPFIDLRLSDFKALKFDLIFHPKMEGWKKQNLINILKALKIKNISTNNSELQLKEWGD